MSQLILGMVIFFGAHSVSIVAPNWRDAMAARVGTQAWRAAYSLVSIAGFILMLRGYAVAHLQPDAMYAPPPALRHLTGRNSTPDAERAPGKPGLRKQEDQPPEEDGPSSGCVEAPGDSDREQEQGTLDQKHLAEWRALQAILAGGCIHPVMSGTCAAVTPPPEDGAGL